MATEVVSLPAARDDADDERIVQALEQYDEYLADQQHAIELLKQGFLKLTMAKMNLPAHAVGELSYKDEFESALYVVQESDGTLSTIKASERSTLGGENTSSASTVKRRKDGASSSTATEPTAGVSKPAPAVSSSDAKEEDAAIMWFSSLPPPNLRLAQKHFRSALQALLVSAASARKIQSAVARGTPK